MLNKNYKAIQECADKVAYIISKVGYQHCVNMKEFAENGVRIVFTSEEYSPLYNEELIALSEEFDNVILEENGLALYDN